MGAPSSRRDVRVSASAFTLAVVLGERHVSRGTWSSQRSPKDPPGPSLETLARECGFSVRTVTRALAELVKAGTFAVDGGSRTGARRVNRYRLLVGDPRQFGLGDEATSAKRDGDPRQNPRATRANLANKPLTDEPSIGTQPAPARAVELWTLILEAARIDPNMHAGTFANFFLTAAPVAAEGNRLTLRSPARNAAEFLRTTVGRYATPGVEVLVTWPGAAGVAA